MSWTTMQVPEKNENDGKEWPVPESGTHRAVCCGLVDLGTQDETYNGESKAARKILILWELPDEVDPNGDRLIVSKAYTYSLHEKSTLRQHIDAWRGAGLKEGEQLDLSRLLGVSCLVTVAQSISTSGRKFAKVTGVTKPLKGQEQIPAMRKALVGLGEPVPDWIPYLYGKPVSDVIGQSREMRGAKNPTSGSQPGSTFDEPIPGGSEDEIPF